MKRLTLALALALAFLIPVKSEASTIIVFGQSTGLNLFTGNETAGVTVLNAAGIPVVISTLNSAGVSINAFFTLSATSTGAAVNVFGNGWIQPYSGSFQITSNSDGTGINYLSGLFDGLDLGIVGGQSFTFGSAQPPLSLSFTSSIAGMPLGTPTALSFSLTNVNPNVFISNGSFGDFTSNISGDASATAVPEPASLLLLGSGLALIVRKLKRRN